MRQTHDASGRNDLKKQRVIEDLLGWMASASLPQDPGAIRKKSGGNILAAVGFNHADFGAPLHKRAQPPRSIRPMRQTQNARRVASALGKCTIDFFGISGHLPSEPACACYLASKLHSLRELPG
jgi:hypothetical protein